MSLMDANMSPADPLNFPEYEEKVEKQQKKTGMKESAVCATGRIGGIKAVCVVLDSHFFMGSMSSVVGEKVTRAIEYATQKKMIFLLYSLLRLAVQECRRA